jgi:glycine cleavage system H lipoate-binding protein
MMMLLLDTYQTSTWPCFRDVVFVECPTVGKTFAQKEAIGAVESVKGMSPC